MSSTLYGVWNALELNLPFHIDIETIVGGKVRDATRALKNFLGKPEKLDVKVVRHPAANTKVLLTLRPARKQSPVGPP